MQKTNAELEKMLAEKSAALNQAQRQLEIEISLERVRVVAMAMQQPDDVLGICELLFKELEKLGFIELRNTMVNIHNDDEGSFLNYDYSGTSGKNITHYMYDIHPVIKKLVKHARTENDTFSELVFKGKKLENWRKFRKKSGEKDDARLENIQALYYYFYSIGKGAVGISTFEPVAGEQLEILKRLRNVFGLAYRRYLDITKAEEQAFSLLKEKDRLEETLNELRTTQSQLIQSEKMASLGELTAGIAHEIQNPLNFVNNFSDLNKELLAEMKEEIGKGNLTEANTIANNIIENEIKINHHGKRADAIVKGMLQHSRSSNGVKEPTDINALADEYLRLAYHGLRAKDKSFNATMKTDFDGSVGMVSIITQDIGRVILNLITNAFYVVDEKKKQLGADYEPTVSISTKKNNGKVEIIVKDNGNGIPAKVFDKIFQPFFTTKPTGQGTGLGLSLSYDIVKAHGGELKVGTKEGEGSEFILILKCV